MGSVGHARILWMLCKVSLVLTPEPEGGARVTSPLLPGLMTCGETIVRAID